MSDEKIHLDTIDRQRAISTLFGTLGGLLVIVVLLSVMLYATRDTTPDDAALREAKLAELRGADARAQADFGWIDKSKGIVRLPIDVAIDKALADGLKLPATQPAKK